MDKQESTCTGKSKERLNDIHNIDSNRQLIEPAQTV